MSRPDGISRRDMLRGAFLRRTVANRACDGLVAVTVGGTTPSRSTTPTMLRPPGAVDETTFLEGCTRCGDCVAACPVDAIQLAGERFGEAAGTPIVDPMVAPCTMCEERACITACEPGVLSAHQPATLGTASIRTANCLAYQGTFCSVCVEQCPVDGAIVVGNGKPRVVETECTGCGVCQYRCPAPYNAVLILPRARDAAPDESSGADDGCPVEDSVPSATASDSQNVTWRDRYFGGRSLRPPESS